MDKIYLVLQNGQVYEGQSFGAKAEVVGELVFNTGMCGFLQMLTDKCYQGQIVVDTFPMLGNYGVNDDVNGKQSAVKAVLTREVCDTPSNFRSKGKISDLMADMGVVGMSGIDTRALTRYIRDNGAQKAIICSNPNLTDAQKKALEEYEVVRPLSQVCANQSKSQAVGKGDKVTLINLGETYDIVDMLVGKGCEVTVVPYNTSAKEILQAQPQGVVLSSGSDFVSDTVVVENTIKELAKAGVSMLGIGLGHEMIAKAMGCTLVKTLHGQHGNQPVKKLDTGRLFTTYQNHNMNVVTDSDDIQVVYRNVNDGSVEGLYYDAIGSMSVAFLPSTNGGPNATDFVYDEFLQLTKENR